MLTTLAKLLRITPADVEDVLRNDTARARETVSRRRFMGAAAALTTTPVTAKAYAFFEAPKGPRVYTWEDIEISSANIYGQDTDPNAPPIDDGYYQDDSQFQPGSSGTINPFEEDEHSGKPKKKQKKGNNN